MPVWIKLLVSAGLLTLISELAKRSDRLGAFIGALPWVTTLAMVWLFAERQGSEKIANHAWYTFWYVLPTLPMFLQLPWMLRRGFSFPLSLLAGVALTCLCLWLTALVARRWGVQLL